MGRSFAAGTTGGPGAFDFTQVANQLAMDAYSSYLLLLAINLNIIILTEHW